MPATYFFVRRRRTLPAHHALQRVAICRGADATRFRKSLPFQSTSGRHRAVTQSASASAPPALSPRRIGRPCPRTPTRRRRPSRPTLEIRAIEAKPVRMPVEPRPDPRQVLLATVKRHDAFAVSEKARSDRPEVVLRAE